MLVMANSLNFILFSLSSSFFFFFSFLCLVIFFYLLFGFYSTLFYFIFEVQWSLLRSSPHGVRKKRDLARNFFFLFSFPYA